MDAEQGSRRNGLLAQGLSQVRLARLWGTLGAGRRALGAASTATLDLVLPPTCAWCHQPLFDSAAAGFLCDPCRRRLLPTTSPACPRCGVRMSDLPGAACGYCQQRSLKFDRAFAVGDYVADLRDAVLRAKQHADERLAIALASLAVDLHTSALREQGLDVVVPIPMHWARRIVRGMNGPNVVADRVARSLRTPVSSQLVRRRYTAIQGDLPPTRRRQNVRNAFQLRHPEDFRGARVLLVDDVMTSCATCNEAVRMLRRAGAEWIAVLVICRTQPAGG